MGEDQLARVLIAVGQEGLSVEGLFVTNPIRPIGHWRASQYERAGDPIPAVARLATVDWKCGHSVTTMREGPAFRDLGGVTTPESESTAPVRPLGGGSAPRSYSSVGSLVFASYLGALRRRRKIWLSFAALGFVVGLGYHVIVPRSYSAHATLYLAQAPGTDPAAGMANDIALLQTPVVGHLAAHLLGEPSLSPSALLGKAPGVAAERQRAHR